MAPPIINIGVHPFAQYSKNSEDLYADQLSFVSRRKARLDDRSVEQILFLEQAVIPQLESFLRDDYWQDRVFLTKIMRVAGNLDTPKDGDRAVRAEKVVAYSDRRTISWRETANRIKNRFPAEHYNFWGAELHLHRETNEIISGCLPFVRDCLQLPGTIDLDASYVLKRLPNEGVPLLSFF